MSTQSSSPDSQSAARLASAVRSATRRLLTVDATVRAIVLTAGGWRLYESATQVYYTVRVATDSAGTLESGETAPSTAFLAAPSAGSPDAALAFPASGTAPTGLAAATLPGDYREIAVRGSAFVVLYVRVASGSTTIALEGPFEATE